MVIHPIVGILIMAIWRFPKMGGTPKSFPRTWGSFAMAQATTDSSADFKVPQPVVAALSAWAAVAKAAWSFREKSGLQSRTNT